MPSDLIGTGEIEKEFGVTRVQVFRLNAAGDWPRAQGRIGNRNVWYRDVIAEHVEQLFDQGRLRSDADAVRIIPRRYVVGAV